MPKAEPIDDIDADEAVDEEDIFNDNNLEAKQPSAPAQNNNATTAKKPYKPFIQADWSDALAFHNRIFRKARIQWDTFFQAKHLCKYIFAYRAYMVLSATYENIHMPPEVLFLHFVHALHPIQYYNDCMNAFGHLVDVDYDADNNNEEETCVENISIIYSY